MSALVPMIYDRQLRAWRPAQPYELETMLKLGRGTMGIRRRRTYFWTYGLDPKGQTTSDPYVEIQSPRDRALFFQEWFDKLRRDATRFGFGDPKAYVAEVYIGY